ncbi:protein containing DUF1570 [Rhodopirellula europaea 6C]|uniref:Protein containing DUF1570 n=2 Tax=Rhodopirellula TaxID=265488 RepID=M2AWK4_9BACT|nr:DUF1570 domain-containing protein [Rhodopirellula europaea]EMB13943.1 protein containing DUF1570 [Rhodopirellula europaea 6C]
MDSPAMSRHVGPLRSSFSLDLFVVTRRTVLILFAVLTFWIGSADSSAHADIITFNGGADDSAEQEQTIDAEILVEAADGGVLARCDAGRLWTIQPDMIVQRTKQPAGPPIDQETMARRMLDELPKGFQVYRTANYLLLHQGNEAYARDCGVLFEQLHRGFFTYWKNQHVDLEEPRYPLVALVLANHNEFLKYASQEIGDTAKSVIGYYHLESNRMTTFRVPNLERNIATIIHEATHQLAYNCGLQTRFADNPMWVSEGLAMFFESPDFSNPRGWRGIGRVNAVNLGRFRRYLSSRPDDSLATLLSDDSRFRSVSTAEDAYGESWALTYFLLKTQRKEFVSYLQKLSESKPLDERTPRERIEDFESSMDMTLEQLDRKFITYMRRVRN